MKVKHAVEAKEEVQVTVLSNATMLQVKEAVAAKLGRPEIVKQARLVKKMGGSLASYGNSEARYYRNSLHY